MILLSFSPKLPFKLIDDFIKKLTVRNLAMVNPVKEYVFFKGSMPAISTKFGTF